MTKQKQDQFDIRGAYEAAEQARGDAQVASEQLHAAEYGAQRERERRQLAAWQDFADDYQPAELRQATVDAGAALRRALEESTLGRALIAYQAAILRESVSHKLARDAGNAGAALPEGVTVPEYRAPVDGAGKQIGGVANDFTTGVLTQIVFDAASGQVNTEEATIRGTAKAAHDSVAIPEPDWYKVTAASFTEDRSDEVGCIYTHFVGAPSGAVAYLRPDNPALRWYQQHDHFDVQVVYGVPGEYQVAARRLALRAADNKPGAAGTPSDGADFRPFLS